MTVFDVVLPSDESEEPCNPWDLEPDAATAVPRPRDRGTRAVRLTGLRTLRCGLPVPPPILVVGGSGGSGVTTTALGLGSVMATEFSGEVWPLVLDATPAGGDLAERGSDGSRGSWTVQDWMSVDDIQRSLPGAVESVASRASSGARVLGRDEAPMPRRETFLSVNRSAAAAGYIPIYDGGAPLRSPTVRPLLEDPCVQVVITVAGRYGAVNRLLPVLRWLGEFNQDVLRDTAVVVTRQSPLEGSEVTDYLATYLKDWVRGVVEIPYDPHLVAGGAITWKQLQPDTQAAYRKALGALTS